MTNTNKDKGDRAEREVEEILRELLGVPARRKLGAGRKDDMGDIDNVPDTTISVANWPNDTLRAAREKPLQVEQQRMRAGARWAASFIRFRGGEYRVVLTPRQFARLWLDAHAGRLDADFHGKTGGR